MKLILLLLVFVTCLSQTQELSEVVKSRDTVKVKELISAGEDINEKGKDRIPPIVAAAIIGDALIANLLLDAGAEINTSGDSTLTPLMEAAARGSLNLVSMFAERGAKINTMLRVKGRTFKDNDGLFPTASSILSGSGTQVIVENERNALMVATENGHNDIVEYLISKKAKVDAQSVFRWHIEDRVFAGDGETALILAAINGHCQVVRTLLKATADADIHRETEIRQYQPVFKPTRLFDMTPIFKKGETALMIAAHRGDSCTVRTLLEGGANIDEEDFEDRTALAFAALKGHSKIVSTLLESNADPHNTSGLYNVPVISLGVIGGNAEVVQFILDRGADVNALTRDDSSPLIIASDGQSPEIIKLLLERKAKVNLKNDKGQTALMVAARKGISEFVTMLLSVGANPNLKDNQEATALTYAKQNGFQNIVDLLVKAGAAE